MSARLLLIEKRGALSFQEILQIYSTYIIHISQVVTHREAEGIGIPGDTADIRLVSGDTSKIHFQEILQR